MSGACTMQGYPNRAYTKKNGEKTCKYATWLPLDLMIVVTNSCIAFMPLDLSLKRTEPAKATLGSQVTVFTSFLLPDKAEDIRME